MRVGTNYQRKVERFGWDRVSGFAITGTPYYPDTMTPSGYTGVLASVSDIADSGVDPYDASPSTYALIYPVHNQTSEVEFTWDSLPPRAAGQDGMLSIAAVCTDASGIPVTTPKRSATMRVLIEVDGEVFWARTVTVSTQNAVPSVFTWTILGSDYDRIDPTKTVVRITSVPPSTGAKVGVGLTTVVAHVRDRAA